MTQIRPLLLDGHWQCSVTVTFRVILSAACADMVPPLFRGPVSQAPQAEEDGGGEGGEDGLLHPGKQGLGVCPRCRTS